MAREPADLKAPAGGTRKVTYTLPDRLVDELDRRATQRQRSKSGVVAAALEAYFAALDREALATIYRDAAHDPLFVSDNASVAEDHAACPRPRWCWLTRSARSRPSGSHRRLGGWSPRSSGCMWSAPWRSGSTSASATRPRRGRP